MKKLFSASLLLLSFLFSTPSARACTVCFGGANGDLADGFFWGVVLLGSLPFIMLTGFISYIVYQSRKNKPH